VEARQCSQMATVNSRAQL